MEKWKRLCRVPTQNLKTIGFGNLKGKSDINPQWRIKAFTEVYGECGRGWYVETVEEKFQECSNGEILVFTTVKLYTATDDNEWSAPVEGKGGNKIVTKNKNGLVPNDEGCKMAFTDALGTAMKCLGVASEIYEGNFDGSKYREYHDATPRQPKLESLETVQQWVNNGNTPEACIDNLLGIHGTLEANYVESIKRMVVTNG